MVYMYHSFLIHSSADGHLGCFHVLAIINSAAMNIGVHVSLSDLVSSVCMPRSGIVGSYGSSISSFLKNNMAPNILDHKSLPLSLPTDLVHIHLRGIKNKFLETLDMCRKDVALLQTPSSGG